MTFAEWSNAKKKNQQPVKTAEDEKSSANSGNAGAVPSFSEWSKRKRATEAIQSWAQDSAELVGGVRTYYDGWSGGSDIEKTSQIFDRRVESLGNTARILGKQYGDVGGVQSYLDNASPILENAKGYSDQYVDFYKAGKAGWEAYNAEQARQSEEVKKQETEKSWLDKFADVILQANQMSAPTDTAVINNNALAESHRSYRDLHGDEKLDKALAVCSEMLANKGITVTDLEMGVLIEAAVAEFNEAFRK